MPSDPRSSQSSPPVAASAAPSVAIRGRVGKARVGVLTVVQNEFQEAAELLGAKVNLTGTPYYVRKLSTSGDYDLVLAQLSGRGNIVSGIGTDKLLENYRPEHVLLAGIGGGVKDRDDTQLGDVVVADFLDGYEMRKITDKVHKRRMEPYDQPSLRLRYHFAQPIATAKSWLKRVDATKRPLEDKNNPKVIFGNLIYGEKILGNDDDEYQKKVMTEFDNAIAVDMESGGAARAVYEARATKHYNPQLLVIRGISDLVNEESNNDTRKKWRPYAAHVAAAFAAELVDCLLQND